MSIFQRRADPYLRSTTSTPTKTSNVLSTSTDSTSTDVPSAVAPSLPPPPPPPAPPLPPTIATTNSTVASQSNAASGLTSQTSTLSSSSCASNPKACSHRITLEDLHQSPILHSTTTHCHNGNGEYRSTLYPNIGGNPTSTPIPSPPHGYGSTSSSNSTISKLVRSRAETESNSTGKDNHHQPAPRIREISSNVGFVSLPDQVHRRAVKKGFEFNLMVVG